MFGDLNIIRFISLVLMFVVSIMFLIVSPNVISILLGWDGLGLVSYLLVIYYQNVRSYGAGMLTVLSNRIGGNQRTDLEFQFCSDFHGKSKVFLICLRQINGKYVIDFFLREVIPLCIIKFVQYTEWPKKMYTLFTHQYLWNKFKWNIDFRVRV